MSLMSNYEENLDDFPVENKDRTAESLVGTYRAESTDQWTTGSGITTKIPPLSDGATSWFKYEELIDDWLDLAVLEAETSRPGTEEQTCWRCRNVQRTYIDGEPLRAADGVKYFRDSLRLHFIRGAQSVILWRFFQVTPSKNRKHRDGQADRKVLIAS